MPLWATARSRSSAACSATCGALRSTTRADHARHGAGRVAHGAVAGHELAPRAGAESAGRDRQVDRRLARRDHLPEPLLQPLADGRGKHVAHGAADVRLGGEAVHRGERRVHAHVAEVAVEERHARGRRVEERGDERRVGVGAQRGARVGRGRAGPVRRDRGGCGAHVRGGNGCAVRRRWPGDWAAVEARVPGATKWGRRRPTRSTAGARGRRALAGAGRAFTLALRSNPTRRPARRAPRRPHCRSPRRRPAPPRRPTLTARSTTG
jgi:hypothetical protein